MKKSKISTAILGSLVCIVLLSSSSLFCQTPKGWLKLGSHPNDYDMVYDYDVKHQGKTSVRINSRSDTIDGFGTFMQTFKADMFKGKRVRLSAWIKTENANSAHMWIRLDSPKGMVGFDNMDNRPIQGTTDWKQYSIVLDVTDETVFIAFGTFVAGLGTAWVDDYKFEIVDSNIPTTDMLSVEEKNKSNNDEDRGNYFNMDFPSEPLNLECEI